LWVSPGQGKSTYLRYLCTQLEELEIPYIRHHYFRDLTDTSGRFSLQEVANCLMAQMEAHHIEHVQGLRNGPQYRREWIEACATAYATEGKVFIIIVDGLDHGWRENDQNRQPLDSLFRCLFPVPENATVLIGTQKVDEVQLPSLFPSFVSTDDWIPIPLMSLAATRGWLEGQPTANRFEFPERAYSDGIDSVTELGAALL
jgi:hypothetical protein